MTDFEVDDGESEENDANVQQGELFVSRVWRDANASDLLDCLDLDGPPAFLEPPELPAPGATANPSDCTPGEPGVIPPPEAVLPRSLL